MTDQEAAMAELRDQIHWMDIVLVVIPNEIGGRMSIKKDPGLAISISLKEVYLMQPSQASGSLPILRSGAQPIIDLVMLEPSALQ